MREVDFVARSLRIFNGEDYNFTHVTPHGLPRTRVRSAVSRTSQQMFLRLSIVFCIFFLGLDSTRQEE